MNPPLHTKDPWLERYGASHTHPVNRLCHSIGIPMIVLSLGLAVAGLFVTSARLPVLALSLALFVAGWAFQFIGHIFEKKPPEFFSDWRFLFVGLRWWIAKMRGQA
jgi:uncharacterized membrane protein YGL010W